MASYTQKRDRVSSKQSDTRHLFTYYMGDEDAVKGMPPYFVGFGLDLIEEMVKDGILLEYKNRECVSINLEKTQEVNRLRELFLKKKFNV